MIEEFYLKIEIYKEIGFSKTQLQKILQEHFGEDVKHIKVRRFDLKSEQKEVLKELFSEFVENNL